MEPTSAPGLSPVAQASATVLTWLAQVGVTATLGPPTGPTDADGAALTLWPLAFLSDQALRTVGQPDGIRLRIRYLVTTDGWDPAVAGVWDRVLAATMVEAPVQLVLEPVPPQLWSAFGVRPRAAVFVDVPVQITRSVVAPPVVRGPLRVDGAAMVTLRGRVLGPGDEPVPGVRVRALDVGTWSWTDNRGCFAVGGVPAGTTTRVLVTGKGLHLAADVAATAQPVELRCDFEEV